VAHIREHVPDCALTMDIIVGFPRVTEEDFARTLRASSSAEWTGAAPEQGLSLEAAGLRE
jgi:tRNA-2-methylthio-N6-dimethylallyladenosine synthase